jgi:hypothetical protein
MLGSILKPTTSDEAKIATSSGYNATPTLTLVVDSISFPFD